MSGHRTALLAAALLLTALPAAAPAGARAETEPLPAELELTTLDGETIRMGDLRGKVVLLDFWATWCKPCRNATPHLRRLHQRLGDQPFEIVGVSVDHDEEALRRYLAEEEIGWTQVWDPGQDAAYAFGVQGFPFYLVIDHEGRPVSKLEGWSDHHPRALDRAVARELRPARKAAAQAGGQAAEGR
jgi:thiol-disulfide isomerase/thioredoxin